MYTLTLSKSERAAFNWVGNRYRSSGDDMRRIIEDGIMDDREWDYDGPITFTIEEYGAWGMKDLADEEDYAFPCFSPELRAKMIEFLDKIV